jgi:very-short-patch-repair endonuclease
VAAASLKELASAVARYHAGCLRVIGAQNVALRDVRTAKKAAIVCDLGTLSSEERIHHGEELRLEPPVKPRGSQSRDDYERRLRVWERLRELAAKAAIERFAKEVVYAAPLLEGYLPRRDRMEPVLAPLFMRAVTVAVEQDGSIVIAPQDEPLRFNTALWADAIPKTDASQIVSQGIDAQADLSANFDSSRIHELLKAIAAVFPGCTPAEPQEVLESWPERPAPSAVRTAEAGLRLQEGAALFLSNRASQYLLHDLEEVASNPGRLLTKDRPLSVLLNPPKAEMRPEIRSPNLDEVVFPFPSNAAQRQVADALEKNQVVVVQGPPGTGKSLTIANLAAHLVAAGKSVLVTSHKQQALTVVQDKLAETDQRFLYASLVGDGATAKRELQKQIANVKAFAGTALKTVLKSQLSAIEKRRHATGTEFASTRLDFLERAEPGQEEAATIYPALERGPTLPLSDPVLDEAEHEDAADALRRLDELARRHREVWVELCESELVDEDDTSPHARAVEDFINHQRARLRAGRDTVVGALVQQWHGICDSSPKEIERAQRAISEIRDALAGPLARASGETDAETIRACAQKLADDAVLLEDCEGTIRHLEDEVGQARKAADARTAVGADPVHRAEVLQRHRDLARLFGRRKARSWLAQHAPGAAGLSADTVKRWVLFWDSWSAVRTDAGALGGGLRTEISHEYDPDAVSLLLKRAKPALALAQATIQARQASERTLVPLPFAEALRAPGVEEFAAVLKAWDDALLAAEADRLGNIAKDDDRLAFTPARIQEVDQLMDAGDLDEAEARIAHLDAILQALPALAERRHLLDTYLSQLNASAEAIEAAAVAGSDPPSFLADPETALRLQPNQHRLNEIAGEKTTRELAHSLHELREQVTEDARRVLGSRIQSRILEGFRKPTFLASLQAFRKAVAASPKRFERFEELKSSETFDVGILIDVFPCWIMRPDDVCRVFPLQPDLFDIVIFDEASQCNPDQCLPLFGRARTVAIFGDDKQLSNEDLRRTLSSNANKALMRQSGLEPLDPAGLFDQTKHSLLDLVSLRQQASVLLNEHFRCRPELAAFSNHLYYGDTLRVIRDRDDDRGLGHALLIREVPDAGDVGPSKVNYVEAAALVEELRRRIADPRYEEMTFGVLSLFREQVEHLEAEIERGIPRRVREKHRLICSTVDGFQGDERDVILYSWRFTASSSPNIFAFTGGASGQQRVNVALTRARHQAIHFISAPIERFPIGASNVTPFLRHAKEPDVLLQALEERAHHEPTGEARLRVASALEEAGFEVQKDFVACGTSIDLLVRDRDRDARVAVFVDAELDEHPPADALRRVDAHGLLERAGWSVVRMPASEALPHPRSAVDLVSASLEQASSSAYSRVEEPAYATVTVAAEVDVAAHDLDLDGEIELEDRADYHWDVASVEARLSAGEDVFQSDFERQLYDHLAGIDGLKVVPQWPTRGKLIDLVLTDREGRRLAVEADGPQHHETASGEIIPEDTWRQELLEDAGWIFHRVRFADFVEDPKAEVARILEALHASPRNPGVAERVWGEWSGEGLLPSDPSTEPLTAEPPREPAPLGQDDPEDPTDDIAKQNGARDEDQEPPVELADIGSNGGSLDPDAYRGSSLDRVPLGLIAMQIAILVADEKRVAEQDLVSCFEEYFDIEVPDYGHDLLNRFAWSAKGRKFIDRDAATKSWVPGTEAPVPTEDFGFWIFYGITDRARILLRKGTDEQVAFEKLLEEVHGRPARKRIPRMVMTVVGKALYLARKE